MNEFTDAVARVPELWCRDGFIVVGVSNSIAVFVASGVTRHWVPVDTLERGGKQRRPVAHVWSSHARERW